MYRQRIHLFTASIICLGMLVIFNLQQPTSADYAPQNTSQRHFQERSLTLTPAPEKVISAFNAFISDENCTLPCWWGFSLGVSTNEEVEAFFQEYFAEENYTVRETEQYIYYSGYRTTVLEERVPGELIYEPPGYYRFFFTVQVDNETQLVEGIRLIIPLPSYHLIDWSTYSISNILEIYGSPDEISFFPPGLTHNHDGKFILRYHSLGLYIGYDIYVDYKPSHKDPYLGNYTICNNQKYINGLLEIWIENTDLSLLAEGNSWRLIRSSEGQSIENISHFSIEEVTQILSQENLCITTDEY